MAVDHNNPQSRDEEILIATIDGTEYNKLPQSRMEELLLELKETIEQGGGGGTSDYENLTNQPQVNGETLIGDKTGADLGLVDAEVGKGLSTNDYDDTEKAAVAAATSAISAIKDGTDLDSFGDVEVALLDKADISDLGTAAAKDSTNAVTSGSTNLVESGAVKEAIDAAVAAAYHHAGTKTVAQLTHDLLIAANEGNVYNITDSGATTSDFIEGIGKTIDEGSNVGICKVGNVYMFDLLSGFVDTTNFVQKSQTVGLLKNDGTVNDKIEGDVDAIDSKIDDSTTYPYADVITIEDAIPANVADCNVKIEPVQDLHGYDHPWVGGAGKNKINIADKASSTSGDVTASCSNGVITLSGTASAQTTFSFPLGSDINLTPSLYKIAYNNTAASSYIAVKFCNDGSVIHSWTPNVVNRVISDWTAAEDETIDEIKIEIATGYPTNMTLSIVVMDKDGTDTSYEPYSNICPISGHTEASVQRDGKNILDLTTYTNNKYLNASGVETEGTSYAISDYLNVDKSLQYSASGLGSVNGTYACFYDDSKAFISSSAESNDPFTFTTPSNARYVRVTLRNVSALTAPQVELGSSAIDYEPYQGKTYTISLGDTIYGGTVDFNSGVMTVDRAHAKGFTRGSVDSQGKLYSLVSTSISNLKNLSSISAVTTLISNMFNTDSVVNARRDSSKVLCQYDATIFVGGYIDDETTLDALLSDLEICYELATPFTVQLTPQQIQLLKGTNTLTASTGQISVTVNGVSGAIGQVQEQVNELAESVVDRFDDIVGYSERVNRLNYKELTWTNGVRDGSGEHTSSEGSHYSNMIEVLPNTTYTISGTISTATVWRIYYLTSNGTWISRSSTLPRPYTFTTPSNCGNIQIQCANIESLSGAQLQYGDVARPFETYKDQLGLLLDRVPAAPTTDGTYNLQVTVVSGTPTYSWVSTT